MPDIQTALKNAINAWEPTRITPGMEIQEVRRRLGKPAKVTPYALSGETHYDWRFLEPPTTPMVFSIITTDGRSVASGICRDREQARRAAWKASNDRCAA